MKGDERVIGSTENSKVLEHQIGVDLEFNSILKQFTDGNNDGNQELPHEAERSTLQDRFMYHLTNFTYVLHSRENCTEESSANRVTLENKLSVSKYSVKFDYILESRPL